MAVVLLLFSCGIQGYVPPKNLKPPLFPFADIISNQIRVTFYAFNDEDYFDGYGIFIADSLDSGVKDTGNLISNRDGVVDKPTIYNVPAMTVATQISFLIERNYNNERFTINGKYYFYVKAYSFQYQFYSDSSEVTNVDYITN